jgi:hypothetical protein
MTQVAWATGVFWPARENGGPDCLRLQLQNGISVASCIYDTIHQQYKEPKIITGERSSRAIGDDRIPFPPYLFFVTTLFFSFSKFRSIVFLF